LGYRCFQLASDLSTARSMTPFYFGATGRRLFGVYDAPRSAQIRRGVVICYPIGLEYYCAHRACCALARQIAEAGMDVLRFDYPGTGDSEGEVCDFSDRDWVASIGQAVEELRDMTGLSKVGLVGLRFGAALAVRSAEQRDDVDRVVLWDPTLDPDECIGDAGRDLYSSELLEGLRELGARGLGVEPARRLLVATEPGESDAEQRGGEEEGNMGNMASTDVRRCPGPSVWQETEDFASGGLPVRAMGTIAEWLAETA
jgi:pimeloyl-ACP methyl ester carboxylesterase